MATRLRNAQPDDRTLAQQAIAKGDDATTKERAALRRVRAQAEEERRQEYARTCPKRHYREWSGRADKVLNEQAALHGFPIGGPVIDLTAVVRHLHDFLSKNKYKLMGSADDSLLQGSDSPALEDFRRARAELARMDVEERKKTHCKITDIEQGLTQIFSAMRGSVEQLQRQYGNDAAALITNGVDEGVEQCRRMFEGVSDTLPNPPALPAAPVDPPPAQPSEPTPCG